MLASGACPPRGGWRAIRRDRAGRARQFTSTADLVTLNARLRYNRREGQDLYLVFNDGLNTDRAAFAPALPLSAGRTLLLKYSHAVPFGW